MTRVIITGAASGIGAASVRELRERGCQVVGLDLHGSEADGILACDVRDQAAVDAAVAEAVERLGGLDVLVNNAGLGIGNPFLEYELDDFRHVLDVNLTGAFVCAQVAARRMVAAGTGGRIVNVTSVHEHVPLEEASAYCAAKGGLGLLTKVMALELAEHDITVNAVAPGEIATPMTDAEDVDPKTLERPGIPAGRPGDAREIAATIAFLASADASYVSGESFVVDGGMLLMAAVANQRLMED